MRRTLFGSLIISVVVWMIFSWPLPRYALSAIPMSHAGGADSPVRTMVPGDHLQLLYYFWLFSDMVLGETPWMYNPYEFHTGDEDARYKPDAYYAPFSWTYTLIAPFGGRALAYNLSGLLSLWITVLFTWLLIRRYVNNPWIIAGASALAIMLPYRWFTLLGGSPTGFGMAMTPLLLWGLDRAVRDESIAGGCWAALAIIFSYTSDLHMFFFNTLLTPGWCIVAFIARDDFVWSKIKSYLRLALPLLPVLIGLIVVILFSHSIATELAETNMAEGRDIEKEVKPFSPNRTGLFGWTDHDVHGQIYIGYTLLVLLGAGGLALAYKMFSKRSATAREALLFAALLAGVALIILLALGPHGPRGGYVYMKTRALISEYGMIRQTGKIFGILPPILALMAAISIHHLAGGRKMAVITLVMASLVFTGWEFGRRVEPPVCRLVEAEPAYAAVAESAARHGERPHALIVTLWPGDSHFASLYQYYVSLYRIRMINGYNPAVNEQYREEIFYPFESINQGWMTDAQVDALRQRGINHILLHEDLFPEKVSPFPVTMTLQMLLTHPRVDFVHQRGPVWAFRLLDETGERRHRAESAWNIYPPARYYELTRGVGRTDPRFLIDETADSGGALRLVDPGQVIAPGITGCPPAPDLRWMIRVRGTGMFQTSVRDHQQNTVIATRDIQIEDVDWVWQEVPFTLEDFIHTGLVIEHVSGIIDYDVALLTAGNWRYPDPGESLRLPAPVFFHAGHIDLAQNAVVLRPDRDEARIVWYGPRMPVPAGEYLITLDVESPAPDGEELGMLYVHVGARELPMTVPVVAGGPVSFTHHHPSNLPITLIFVYHARADITMREVILTRSP